MKNPSTLKKFFQGNSLSLKEVLPTTSKRLKKDSNYSLKEDTRDEEFPIPRNSKELEKMDTYKTITSFETDDTESSGKEQEKLRSLYDENPFFRERINTRSQRKLEKMSKSGVEEYKYMGERKETTTLKELKMRII